MRGTINWYIAERGFGFIKPDAGGADLFVHIKAFPLGIIPVAGMRVSYETAVNARSGKLEAVAVQMLGW
jgi:CspA family cold shock protein